MEENSNKTNLEESFLIKALIAILTTATATINFILAAVQLGTGQGGNTIIWLGLGIIFVAITIIVLSLLNVHRNAIIRSQKDYEKRIDDISNVTHMLLHRIRNSINYVEDIFFEEKYNSIEEYEKTVTTEMLQLMDMISNVFSTLANASVRVCIKCIKYNEENLDDVKLMTFVRSGFKNIDEIMSEHKKAISIKDNTDFEEIIQSEGDNEQRQYFFEKDLKEYAAHLRKNGRKYKNSNTAWEKSYLTTIVCPIRIKDKEADSNQNNYNLMGFICIDSMDIKAFDNEYADFCLDLMKGLADILYVFFERFISCYYFIREELN